MKLLPIYKKAIIGTISILLLILFIYTASSKLLDLRLFELRLGRMPYIEPYAPFLSWSLPLLELVIAGLLLFPKLRIIGLYVSGILLTHFTIYIIAVLKFSDDIPCSCGGVLSALGWDDHIVFNAICMALVLTAIVLNKKQHKTSNV
ncbi:MAG: hypothetical protein CMH46_16590 [Muricauda sp.]|nr:MULTISPECIES: MauE/DoxX family redox-associated membrane protein [unclassified Allomuricauda]MAU17147.1 hypothetical protein [Allomuricauda sp.]|tara:strand:- start:2248 stop:2688 length:441 start_codon:yes stop_codon:yes gene_type:complete